MVWPPGSFLDYSRASGSPFSDQKSGKSPNFFVAAYFLVLLEKDIERLRALANAEKLLPLHCAIESLHLDLFVKVICTVTSLAGAGALLHAVV